ncbi:MAG: hypothetical protein FWF97_04265 [Alphaproteobacteria bacterium]|nr:hypothetical protein [Alphaproteobacteria bacterium]
MKICNSCSRYKIDSAAYRISCKNVPMNSEGCCLDDFETTSGENVAKFKTMIRKNVRFNAKLDSNYHFKINVLCAITWAVNMNDAIEKSANKRLTEEIMLKSLRLVCATKRISKKLMVEYEMIKYLETYWKHGDDLAQIFWKWNSKRK